MRTPIRFYSGEDIDLINKQLWSDIDIFGNPINFGDETEIKPATEVMAVFQLWGKALDRLYKGDLPKGWVFGKQCNLDYREQLRNPDPGEQPYTYGQRASKIIPKMRKALKKSIDSGIQSNRICGTIWENSDIDLKSPPCWQWTQIKTSEVNKCSLIDLFRSNDGINAYAANMGAIYSLFVDEVILPAGGVPEELIWIATSEHCYDYDRDTLEALIGKRTPQMKRILRGGK